MKILNDNTFYSLKDFEEIGELKERIIDKKLEQLAKEGVFIFPNFIPNSEDLVKEQVILQLINNQITTRNVMGFLGYKQERLIISSRFSINDDDYFFQYMIETVLKIPNILNFNTDANDDNRSYNMLVFIFPYLLKAALRKGIYKTYLSVEYNDNNIKGVINVTRHIRQNTPFIGKIAYTQREFSFDNELMQLIRHTIEYIKNKPYGRQLLNGVEDEVKQVVEVTSSPEISSRQKIVVKNRKNTIRHAYYHKYSSLQRLCIMILQNEKHQIGYGNNQIHGVLFDGAWLWEEYINSLISDKFYHPMNKVGKGAQQLFYSNSGKTGLIYPDFLGKNLENRVVADAKYKPIGNIGNKDYLQLLAYMFRFDSKQGFYLYPEHREMNLKELYLNSGSSYEKNVIAREDILVTKLGLNIPQYANSYEDFKKQITKSEEEFISCLYKK